MKESSQNPTIKLQVCSLNLIFHPIWNKLAVVGSVMFVKIFSGLDASMLSLHMISGYEVSVPDMETITQVASVFFTNASGFQ